MSRLQEIGAIAQLGERLHGMQEVGGSIPPGSTIHFPILQRKNFQSGGLKIALKCSRQGVLALFSPTRQISSPDPHVLAAT